MGLKSFEASAWDEVMKYLAVHVGLEAAKKAVEKLRLECMICSSYLWH
jgi:hypothetical protein